MGVPLVCLLLSPFLLRSHSSRLNEKVNCSLHQIHVLFPLVVWSIH